MITVGLDFGTHQTKICIEKKDGAELGYKFFRFKDLNDKEQYTLPSIIHIDEKGQLTYGYIPKNKKGEIVRYFKQAAFTSSETGLSQMEAIHFSIWYIAFILFDLEEEYGQDFSIQMGVPSDGARLKQQKILAVRILLSAYKLVEEVFRNNKHLFLYSTIQELESITELVMFSQEKKEEFTLLVFPEAYACLMPLVKLSKITEGMSLMIDIGGGTTDISFFTIKNGKPQVYDFYSINKGLNYLTDAINMSKERTTSNVEDGDIQNNRITVLQDRINSIHDRLIGKLKWELKIQTNIHVKRLINALKGRPIIYSGGGSTFKILRKTYGDFKDVMYVSEKEWNTKSIKDIGEIQDLGLCPILSTAYGLSISVTDDEINCEPFRDLFSNLRPDEDKEQNVYTSKYNSFSYTDDYDAIK